MLEMVWRKESLPSYTGCGGVNWCSHNREQYGGSLINRVTIWSSNPNPGHISKKHENSSLGRNMHLNVHNIIYNSQDMEAAHVSINRELA